MAAVSPALWWAHTLVLRFAYFNRTGNTLSANSSAWTFTGYTTAAPTAAVPWTPGTRHSPANTSWPAKGLHVMLAFKAPASAPAAHQDVVITVNYEMYQGIPLLAKWLTLEYAPAVARTTRSLPTPVTLDSVVPEMLAVNFEYAPSGATSWLLATTDLAHGAQAAWVTDPDAPLAPGAFEMMINASYTLGPGVVVPPAGFDSFRVLEMVTGTHDPERYGLCQRKLTRTLAPWYGMGLRLRRLCWVRVL